jgi:hypothetical protein
MLAVTALAAALAGLLEVGYTSMGAMTTLFHGRLLVYGLG